MNPTMTHTRLRDEVQQAIRSEWAAFAVEHPRLAEVMDETLLVQQACESLRDDPDYQQAIESAAAIGAAGEVVSGVVRKLVGQFLRRIIP